MFQFYSKLLLLFIMSILLIACSNENTNPLSQGEQLFKQQRIGFVQAPGCILCHSLQQGIIVAGPSLYAIGERANQIKPNMNAQQYIYESIIDPAAYVVEGYRHDLMYPHYANDLEAEEIKALVDFLISLK